MALPDPNVESGAVIVSFQANIDGYTPVTKIIPADKVVKIMRAVTEITDGYPPAPVYTGLADWFEKTMKQYQFRELDARFQDQPTQEELVLQAQMQAIQAKLDQAKAKKIWLKDKLA